ncbi:glycosyltransferase family 2 protein [Flavobacterium branchiicola]|uniref:Glycosyltransferase family 2 protein n=1 Tax=Flavobacterium branchiicola TaxID=1114875 RepID=A0ABV9PHK3_9FLAO|nr:glycosyltransferase family A protein [Flavobacterium branchiicola]MBS7255479.1 glycosyltransferase family 2 protein [Flavobacterium branchiicola]
MKIQPLVSVIIPCYNDHEFIHEAINSINNQDYKNVEIIIVDDGSDLKTKEVLKNISQENIQIFSQENLGPSTARNKAIKESKGDYFLTLDADDYFEPSFLSKSLNILLEKESIGIVSCWYRLVKNGIIKEVCKLEGGDIKTIIFNNGASGNSLYRKQCWIDVDGYDEKMREGFEDWEFHIRIVESNWNICIIKEELFNYRDKNNSRNKKANKLYRKSLHRYIYFKHKHLYIDNFEETVDLFLNKIEKLERRGVSLKNSNEYKLGKFVLIPLRIVKFFYRKLKKD